MIHYINGFIISLRILAASLFGALGFFSGVGIIIQDVSTFAFERAYFYPRPRGDGSGTTAQSRWGGERFVENGEW